MEQERAACYHDRAKALLVLAGAGCGKTKTLIARALFLHRELNVPAEKIALLTFTCKAAKEISLNGSTVKSPEWAIGCLWEPFTASAWI